MLAVNVLLLIVEVIYYSSFLKFCRKDGKEMYGADQDTMQSYKMMLKAFKEYFEFLKDNASNPEEQQLLERTAHEMSQM